MGDTGYEPVAGLVPLTPLNADLITECSACHPGSYRVKHSFAFVLHDGDRPVAVKLHKQKRQPDEAKNRWLPVGQKGHGFSTLWPKPDAQGDEWIVVAPGELKALAVLGCGIPSTAITGGESSKWSPSMLAALKPFKVALNFDDDPAGIAFRESSLEALKHCRGLKAFTFGREGDKKLDANDIAFRFGQDELRKRINAAIDAACDLAVQPFDIEMHRKFLGTEIRRALNASETEILLSVVGAGKSTEICNAIKEDAERRYVAFCSTHEIAREYETRLGPAALRVVSPDQMSHEGLGPDKDGKCPNLDLIRQERSLGLPYFERICGKCPFQETCLVIRQKATLNTRVLILQHAHLRMMDSKPEYLENRTAVIDESCIQHLRWKERFSLAEIEGFENLLSAFQSSDEAKKFPEQVVTVRRVMACLKALTEGHSLRMGLFRFQQFDFLLHGWTKWLKDASVSGKNLMPMLLNAVALNTFVRRNAEGFWTIRSAVPESSTPLLILDATPGLSEYKLVLGNRAIKTWPEGDAPPPVSNVVQFVEGRYPVGSLWDEKNGKTTKAFEAIMAHISQAVAALNLPPEQVGIICAKKLKPAVEAAFPGTITGNYGGGGPRLEQVRDGSPSGSCRVPTPLRPRTDRDWMHHP